MAKVDLDDAKREKNDEFYTQYQDIERELNAYIEFSPNLFKGKTVLLPCDDPEWSNFTRYFAQNFEKLELKKLISTSYAPNSKPKTVPYQPTLFEIDSDSFDEEKSHSNGRIFTLEADVSGDKRIDFDDLEWSYLEGDGDFRSEEVTRLREQSDFVITNPPFSLFREFVAWLMEGQVRFSIIGNKNAITYKEFFPLLQKDLLWLGYTPMSRDMLFRIPEKVAAELVSTKKEGSAWKSVDGEIFGRSTSVWFTNIEHGRRQTRIPLMTQEENIKFSKHKEVKGVGYKKYENFDAIDIPYTDAIPDDYVGAMGVPISFLDKYNPEQFRIVKFRHGDDGKDLRLEGGKTPYFRIVIQKRGEGI